MKIEILGSGGSVITPKPFCNCKSCEKARSKKQTRFGPSVFIHGPNLLIDTPEEISIQINRTEIQNINAVIYSHWHPDHTAGKRLFEMNEDTIGIPPKNKKTKIIIPEKVASTFNKNMAIMESLKYYNYLGIIDLIIIKDNEEYNFGDYTINPIQLAVDYVFGYEIYSKNKKALIIMDEMKNWNPGVKILNKKYNTVYVPFGVFDVNPITKERMIDGEHPILEDEHTINETIEIIKKLNADVFVLSHIEEPDNISYKLGEQLSKYYTKKLRKQIIVAYDGLMI